MSRGTPECTDLHWDEGVLLLRRDPYTGQVRVLEQVVVLRLEVLGNRHLLTIAIKGYLGGCLTGQLLHAGGGG